MSALYKSDLIDIKGTLRRETEKAYLAVINTKEVWLPKSQVEYDPDAKTFTMPEWLAAEKEID